MSYPHLFPSGFIEFQDNCSGPVLYRDQPSRESDGVRLNDWLQKYVTGQYKGGDFLRLATNMRNTTRMWNRLPEDVKAQFRSLIKESNFDSPKIEHFGDATSSDATSGNTVLTDTSLSSMLANPDGSRNVKMNVFVIVIVAIVAVVIGFLIACACV